jgi:hypothetical protein
MFSDRLLGKMKFARGLRQLGLDHILWGHRVVRVERAHRIRIVRDVQKFLDLVILGVIDFGHIRFEVGRRLVWDISELEVVKRIGRVASLRHSR